MCQTKWCNWENQILFWTHYPSWFLWFFFFFNMILHLIKTLPLWTVCKAYKMHYKLFKSRAQINGIFREGIFFRFRAGVGLVWCLLYFTGSFHLHKGVMNCLFCLRGQRKSNDAAYLNWSRARIKQAKTPEVFQEPR